MATAEEYAKWIVANANKKGTPEFETVAHAYQIARGQVQPQTNYREQFLASLSPERRALAEKGMLGKEGFQEAIKQEISGKDYTGLIPAAVIGKTLRGIKQPFTGATRGGAEDVVLGQRGADWDVLESAIREQDPIKSFIGDIIGEGIKAYGLTRIPGVRAMAKTSPYTFGTLYGAGSGALEVGSPEERAIKGGLGAAGGFLGTGAAQGAGWLLGKGSDLVKGIANIVDTAGLKGGAKRSATRIIQNVINEAGQIQTADDALRVNQKIDTIIRALQKAKPGETAAQAATKTGQAPFIALGDIAEQEMPSAAVALRGQQEAARRAALQAVTPDEQAAIAAREAITQPMRQAELEAANMAGIKGQQLSDLLEGRTQSMISALQNKGRMATEAAQAEQRALSYYPVEGLPRISPRYSPNMERVPEYSSAREIFDAVKAQRQAEAGLRNYQLESLGAHGLYPLESGGILSNINKTLGTPGIRASDVAQKSLGYIRDKIASLTDERGVINAIDLYTVRKEIGNVVSQFAKESNNWDKKLVSGIQQNIQSSIDDAIEKAGGTGWKNYLKQYAEMSVPVNQARVLQAMQAELAKPGGGERVGPFLNVLGKGEEALLKRSTGFPRYGDIGQVLSPQQIGTVQNIAGQLERDIAQTELAQAGRPLVNRILREQELPGVGPGLIERKISATNWLLRQLEGKGGEKVNRELARLMQPENMPELIDVMKAAKPSVRAKIIKEMTKRGVKLGGGLTGQLLMRDGME
jgi:hypothetical protein